MSFILWTGVMCIAGGLCGISHELRRIADALEKRNEK
jgi:hypothetical protein